MSLATRCSACGTAFRVVQDQLKVSEGWVRCGHCGEVFDALEGLFDLERSDTSDWDQSLAGPAPGPHEEAAVAGESPTTDGAPLAADAGTAPPSVAKGPHNAQAPMRHPDEVGSTTSASAPVLFIDPGRPTPDAETSTLAERAPLESHAAMSSAASGEDPIDEHLFGGRRGERRRAAAVQVWDRDRPDFTDARYDSDLAAEPSDADELGISASERIAPDAPLESAVAHPEFLRSADHRARWERPGARLALAGVAVLAMLALSGQTAHHFRDEFAARWPSSRPTFDAWCRIVGCAIEAPRRIGQVSVESTALARAPGNNAFRLAVTLRNRAPTPLATPSLDLTLTDASGRLVARRALSPRDLAPAVMALTPGTETVLQALLDTGDPRVTGYTVEIFYP